MKTPEIKRDDERQLAKRFYKDVSTIGVDGGFGIMLDTRLVSTPARNKLTLPTEVLAQAVAREWDAQAEHVDPATMPIMRIASTALDRVAKDKGPAVAEIANFAGSDLLCYRAEEPEELVHRQAAAWEPLLDWAQERFGRRLVVAGGIMPVTQPAEAVAAIRAHLETVDPIPLTALHTLVTITGSAVLGLAVLEGRLDAADAWEASRIDETFQAEQWGEDAEATARAEYRRVELEAAALVLAALNE